MEQIYFTIQTCQPLNTPAQHTDTHTMVIKHTTPVSPSNSDLCPLGLQHVAPV